MAKSPFTCPYLRMKGFLNDLMAKELGSQNNANFLPKVIRPTGEVTFQR